MLKILFPALLTMFCATRLVADDSPLPTNAGEVAAVKQAAQAALTNLFLPRAELNKPSYGFEENDVVEEAVLKTPVELLILDDNSVLAYRAGQPVTTLLKPTGQWLVPVAIGGTNRAMIQVTQDADHHWTGSGWGMSPLSRKWQSIKAWWPESGKFTPVLIISPSMQGYFFTVPQVEPANLTALAALAPVIADAKSPPPPLEPADRSLAGMQKNLQQLPPEPLIQTNK